MSTHGTADAIEDGELSPSPDGLPSPRAPEGIAGLAKGLAVIEAFGVGRPHMTVADAARAANITRAAARRCLLTLTELGYLQHDGKRFSPTPRLLRLGSPFLDSTPLPQLAQPLLAEIRDQVQESFSLSVLDDGAVLFLARADPPRITAMGIPVGARLPAYCSASGRVLLAALSDEGVEEYLSSCRLDRRTPKTQVDPGRIAALVRQTREEGVAVSDEELELGLLAMATPVKNSRGETLGAVAVSTSAARVTAEELRRVALVPIMECAARLGSML
jgi:IclR family pca regulon transcriptional regulator